jgi:hypothetical protein
VGVSNHKAASFESLESNLEKREQRSEILLVRPVVRLKVFGGVKSLKVYLTTGKVA